jgi:aldose 1-epimerase
VTPDVVRLARGGTALEIDLDHGARAVSWKVDGLELLRRTADSSIDYGMYPMAPWAGRVRGNRVAGHDLAPNHGPWAIHGTVLDSATSVVHSAGDADMETLVVECRHDPGPRWPWATRTEITWQVRADSVRSRVEVRAVNEAFPVVLGWHPWFARQLVRGAEAIWVLEADVMAERGGDHLPTGELITAEVARGPFDDAFRVPGGAAAIRWPGALSIQVSSAPWFVVFDERPEWVCLEPQSGPPNGINDALGGPIAMATPERSVALDVTWTITREA